MLKRTCDFPFFLALRSRTSTESMLYITINCKKLLPITLKPLPSKLPEDRNIIGVEWCGEWDSNPRTPTGQAPEACAFDLARRPPHYTT